MILNRLFENVFDLLKEYYYGLSDLTPQIIMAVTLVAIFYLLGAIIKRGYVFSLSKYFKDRLASELVGQLIKWTLVFIGVFLGFHVLGFTGIASKFLAGAGLTAIVIGFAFRDIVENFLAGILLASSRPFHVGNIIESGGYRGKVRSVSLRNTHIKASDGRDIYIPNASVIKNPLINFTRDGLIRQEFIIGIGTHEDVLQATSIIREIIAKQKEVIKLPQPSILLDEITEGNINLKVFFWLNIIKLPATPVLVKSEVMRKVKEKLIAEGFSLPSITIEHKWDKNALQVNINKKSAEE